MRPALRVLLGGLGAVAAGYALPNAGLSQTPSAADAAQESIVYIYFQVTDPQSGARPSEKGTGFIVSKDGYVLTAAHLFRKWNAQLDVEKNKNVIRGSLQDQPERVSGSPLRLEPVDLGNPDGVDVALLKLPASSRDYPVAPVCLEKGPKRYTNFVAYGFPEDHPFQPIPGTFGNANAPRGRWSATSAFTYGMSGGPVYADGTVVGMVEGGLPNTDAVRWITPIRFATPQLLMAGVSGCPQHSSSQPQPQPISQWSLDNCREEATKARREFEIDHSVLLRVPKLIDCKNPLGYKLRGNSEFFRGDYHHAEMDFEQALKYLPPEAGDDKLLWQSDLADTYLENGKIPEAESLYKQVFDATHSDFSRFAVGRAYVYEGHENPSAYVQAISILKGVDPNYAGQTQKGVVQIMLAAAEAGRIDAGVVPSSKITAATDAATKQLCDGIKKSDFFWRSVLKGTKSLENYSFSEEKRLTGMLGGGDVHCSN